MHCMWRVLQKQDLPVSICTGKDILGSAAAVNFAVMNSNNTAFKSQ